MYYKENQIKRISQKERPAIRIPYRKMGLSSIAWPFSFGFLLCLSCGVLASGVMP